VIKYYLHLSFTHSLRNTWYVTLVPFVCSTGRECWILWLPTYIYCIHYILYINRMWKITHKTYQIILLLVDYVFVVGLIKKNI